MAETEGPLGRETPSLARARDLVPKESGGETRHQSPCLVCIRLLTYTRIYLFKHVLEILSLQDLSASLSLKESLHFKCSASLPFVFKPPSFKGFKTLSGNA